MSNLSDKDIDRLSRDAADLYEPDPSSLSWSRLEQKLIEQIPERPPDGFRFSRMNPLVWGSAVIVIAALSIFIIKNFNYSPHSTRSNQQLSEGSITRLADSSKLSGISRRGDSLNSGANNMAAPVNTSVPVNSELKTIVKDPSSFDPLKRNSEISKNNSVVKNRSKIIGNVDVAGRALIAANIATSRNPGGAHTQENKNTKSNSIYGSASSKSGAASLLSNSGSNQIEDSRDLSNRHSLPAIVSDYYLPETIKGNESILVLPDHPVSRPYKSLRLNRSLNFGLSFGPDYTDAGGITNNQLGNNIGLTVGYYLTDKFSLNTGIFYSNKFFWAPGQKTGNSTRSVNQPWTAAAPPPIDYINGAANIWEIPLTLRYDFAQSEKTKFFLNAGLSSYFLMKQTYINFFYSGQRLLAYKTYDDQQLNYWFKVADISFGFETDLGKGFSFQAEPYFKLPLTTMGVENLKLNSYGFLLSFRYSPVLSRTKK
ncbi:MAG TPA: outer membrane beta-barrel protein [Puia sp.]|nr:outer membrane beta-barrel protein [Puia sp.]